MQETSRVGKDPNLPYGMVLTRIFRHFKIPFDDETELTPPRPEYNSGLQASEWCMDFEMPGLE